MGILKISTSSVLNTKLASFQGVAESTIRAKRKKFENGQDKEYSEMLKEYIKNKRPFYTIDEYIEIEEVDKSKEEIIKDIENGVLSGIIQEDEVYIPTVANDAKDYKSYLSKEFPIVITNSNHKGGVAKTTNIVNIASVYALLGFKVLIVDNDPQGNASQSFGIYDGTTIVDLIYNINDDDIEQQVRDSIIDLKAEEKFSSKLNGCLHLIPNNDDMVDKIDEYHSLSKKCGAVEPLLNEVIGKVKDDYDIILIDTPPRADTVLLMGLLASDYVILSLKAEPFARTGMPKIIHNIKKYEQTYKRLKNGNGIEIIGGIMSVYEKNVNLQKTNNEQIVEDLISETDGAASVFKTYIPKATVVAEATQGAGSVLFFQPDDEIVKNYMDVSIEIIEKILINRAGD